MNFKIKHGGKLIKYLLTDNKPFFLIVWNWLFGIYDDINDIFHRRKHKFDLFVEESTGNCIFYSILNFYAIIRNGHYTHLVGMQILGHLIFFLQNKFFYE